MSVIVATVLAIAIGGVWLMSRYREHKRLEFELEGQRRRREIEGRLARLTRVDFNAPFAGTTHAQDRFAGTTSANARYVGTTRRPISPRPASTSRTVDGTSAIDPWPVSSPTYHHDDSWGGFGGGQSGGGGASSSYSDCGSSSSSSFDSGGGGGDCGGGSD